MLRFYGLAVLVAIVAGGGAIVFRALIAIFHNLSFLGRLSLSVRTLVPVALSTITATYVSRLVFGSYSSFIIPELQLPDARAIAPWVLLSYVSLGIVMGGAATLFIKMLYAFEDFFEHRFRANYYVRHVGAMLLVGTLFYGMLRVFGNYYIEGVGYATVQDVLTGSLSAPLLLLLLFVLKMIATSLTLGSGASGGVFSPAFFMGATVGGAFGAVLKWAFPGLNVSPPAFAVAGMAGMVGASTGAAVAAIVMIFEMTRDYNVIVPMTITVALAYGVRTALSRESIYTMKLVLRGRPIPQALRANVGHHRLAREVMRPRVLALDADMTLEAFAKTVLEHPAESYFLVRENDRIKGVASRGGAALDGQPGPKTLRNVADAKFAIVPKDAMLADVLAAMSSRSASLCLVTSRLDHPTVSHIAGIITDHELAGTMIGSNDIFQD